METTLPTIADILGATDFLSPKNATNKVVKISQSMVVKYGYQVPLLEAQNMVWIRAKSNVPVPKVFGTLTEPGPPPCRNFIIMEFVEGQTLLSLIDDLSVDEKSQISFKIKAALESMRTIPSPGYLGSLDRQPCFDGLFYNGLEPDPAIAGPFDNESALNQGILNNVKQYVPAAYLKFIEDMMNETMCKHRVCYTHADLQPKNIMVQKLQFEEDGKTEFRICILDWEFSGWYPDYWEFCNATGAARQRPQWLEMMRTILTTPIREYLLTQILQGILLC